MTAWQRFIEAVIRRGPIAPAEVDLRLPSPKLKRKAEFDGKNPRLPYDPSYMRGWNQVASRTKR